jgi:hypothetical protein
VAEPVCTHLDQVKVEPPDTAEACEDCVREGRRDWFHLRVCLTCGHMGCCDNSPGRHATGHFHDAGHALIRSAQPGEDWCWCYIDEQTFVIRFQ